MYHYPIITEKLQRLFENDALSSDLSDETPNICGYYGRACRQMNKPEGANRCLCHGCPLKLYAIDHTKEA